MKQILSYRRDVRSDENNINIKTSKSHLDLLPLLVVMCYTYIEDYRPKFFWSKSKKF